MLLQESTSLITIIEIEIPGAGCRASWRLLQVQDLANVRDFETASFAPYVRNVFRPDRSAELPLRV